MISKSPITSHNRKLLFERVLSAELANCRYTIMASYEWKNKSQIFSIRFTDDKTIELNINLNFKAEKVFSDSNRATELTIRYRSYFIITYLHCLESAFDAAPNTLFQGLIVLEAIKIIHSGATVATHSPLYSQVVSSMRPIDIHCAIRSLSRIRIELQDFLPLETREKCEEEINWMINYTLLPEVKYNKRKKPEYAILSDLLCIKKLVIDNPSLLAQYSLFSQYNFIGFDGTSVYELLANDALSEFWVDVLIRVLAFSEGKTSAFDATAYPLIRNRIVKFKEDSVVYYNECNTSNHELLRTNLLAVKKIAMNIEQTFFENCSAETGALHFMQ